MPAPGDADFEEFVEVAREDAEESQPLEQRHVRILGQRQDATVECELRQLAVEQRSLGQLHWERRDRSRRASPWARPRLCQ